MAHPCTYTPAGPRVKDSLGSYTADEEEEGETGERRKIKRRKLMHDDNEGKNIERRRSKRGEADEEKTS